MEDKLTLSIENYLAPLIAHQNWRHSFTRPHLGPDITQKKCRNTGR